MLRKTYLAIATYWSDHRLSRYWPALLLLMFAIVNSAEAPTLRGGLFVSVSEGAGLPDSVAINPVATDAPLTGADGALAAAPVVDDSNKRRVGPPPTPELIWRAVRSHKPLDTDEPIALIPNPPATPSVPLDASPPAVVIDGSPDGPSGSPVVFAGPVPSLPEPTLPIPVAIGIDPVAPPTIGAAPLAPIPEPTGLCFIAVASLVLRRSSRSASV